MLRCAALVVLATLTHARNETRAAHYAQRAMDEKVRVIHGSVRCPNDLRSFLAAPSTLVALTAARRQGASCSR